MKWSIFRRSRCMLKTICIGAEISVFHPLFKPNAWGHGLFKAGSFLKGAGWKCQSLRTAPHLWCRSRDSTISFHKDSASKLRKDTELVNNPLQKQQEWFSVAATKQETKTNKAGNVCIVPIQMKMDRCAQTGKVICPTIQRSAQGTLIVKTTVRFNKRKAAKCNQDVVFRWTNVPLNIQLSCFPSKLTPIQSLKPYSVFLTLSLLKFLKCQSFHLSE